jgi:polysaccharide biosynthesis transport protein
MPDQLSLPPGERSTPTSFRDVWSGLQRNRWLILATTGAAIAAAGVIVWMATPQYESEATLRFVTQERQSTLLGGLPEDLAQMAGPNLQGGDIDTEIGVLRSRRIAEEVVDSFALHVTLVKPGVARDSILRVMLAPREVVAGEFIFDRERDGSYAVKSRSTRGPVQVPASVRVGEPFQLGSVQLALSPTARHPDQMRVMIQPFFEAVEGFRNDLRVQKQEGRSRLVEVSYRDADRDRAATIVNAVIDNFVAYRTSADHSDLRHRVEALRTQVADYQRELGEAEQQLRAFRETHRIVEPEEEAVQTVRMLAGVRNDREQAVIERESLGRLLSELERGGSEGNAARYRQFLAYPSFLTNEGVQSILTSLNALEDQRSELLLLRTPENEEVVRLTQRIEVLERQLHRIATDYLRSLDSRIASADASLARFGSEMQSVPQRELDYTRLVREQRLLSQVYLGLQSRLRDAEVQYAAAPPEVRVVDTAIPGDEPVWPKPMVMLILATMLGMMAGVVLAVGREAMNTKVRSQLDAELAAGGLPVVGMIPHIEQLERGAGWRERLGWRWRSRPLLRGASVEREHTTLVTRDEPQHGASEAFRALRTSLVSNGAGQLPHVLVVASPLAGDGKSTSSANLAITLAQQGFRVLLVDGDLRRGTLHDVLGAHRAPGLSEVLEGTHDFADALQELDLQGQRTPVLHLLAAGAHTTGPAELLGSGAMRGLLERVRSEYDRIVIDTPPLQLAADGLVLSGIADSVLLVVRAGATDRGVVQQSVTRLRRMHVPLAGIILNDLDPLSSGDYDAALYAGRADR